MAAARGPLRHQPWVREFVGSHAYGPGMHRRHVLLNALRLGRRTLFGTTAMVAIWLSATSPDPRWQKTIDIILATAVLLAAVTNTRRWSTLRGLVGGAAGLFLAVSGVAAGLSVDEALGLISGAFLLSGFAWFLGRPERRAATQRAEETLTALTAVQAELAALRAALTPAAPQKPRMR